MKNADPSSLRHPRQDPAQDVLSTSAPAISLATAERLLREHYDMEGEVSPLAGERDHNFLVRTPDDRPYVLKIAHPAETMDAVRFQNGALRHIAQADPQLRVPMVVESKAGETEFELAIDGDRPRIVRLLTFLEGEMLHRTQQRPQQDRNLGAFLARLGLALSGFEHPGVETLLLWDLRQMPRSRFMVADIVDAGLRALIEDSYDHFETSVLPALCSLRSQIVHNDMNPYNVVVDPASPSRISGMIDFGDMVHGPLVSDIAVGAAYRWGVDDDPLAGAARFVGGYASVRGLQETEAAILFDLIKARLALTITIANWQSRQFPQNSNYVLRLHDELKNSLRRISQIDAEQGRRCFVHTVAMEA